MTQKISSVNIEAATLSSFTGPTISSVAIANSTYVILDDTAVSNAGGYAVITGTNFVSGAQVLFGSTSATAVSFVDSTTLNVQVPALTAGSYVMYVQNPDGSTAIRLNGITSSPIPVWSTGSTLTTQVADVAISISLSASSDSNVVYSLANGSSLPAGTTLASNGLFSGTVTGITTETTYNFTVNAIDAENQDTSRAFSVTVTAGDLYFNRTSLLLNSETSNNTWITDTSSNAFALTVNGDTKPVAFSPYETVWSNYFDGTGDYLTVPANAAFNFGTGDYTIEGWIHVSSTSWTLYATGGAGSQDQFSCDAGTLYWEYSALSGGVANFFTSSDLNKWTHVAVSRSSGTLRVFKNGAVMATGSTSTSVGSSVNTVQIGRRSDGFYHTTGWMSNIRVLKGTGLYTSTFTPPTSGLAVVTNTSLLTCQSNRLIDKSTNNFTLTRNGDVLVSSFGPFVETATTTGSGYFDGTGDYLTYAHGSELAFGTGDFTVEFWMYSNATTLGILQGDTNSGWGLAILSGTLYWQNVVNVSNLLTPNVSAYLNNSWKHWAVVRSSGTTRLYIDGVQITSASDSTNYSDSSGTFYVGYYPANGTYMNGYISNLRIVKGTAVYTSAFTPPTSPLTAIANTSLLTLQSCIGENNSRIIDTSTVNHIVTRNGNATQGTFSPFSLNGWSNYFDGSSTLYFSGTPISTTQSNFTIEAWVYLTANPTFGGGVGQVVVDGNGAGGGSYWGFGLTADRKIVFRWYTGSSFDCTSVGTVSLNTWTHIAVSVSSNAIKLFIEGTQQSTTGTSTLSNRAANQGFINIGRYATTDSLYGYISNARIVTGAGLYTTNFTPSISPLTTTVSSGTVDFLSCRYNNFADGSTGNRAPLTVGTPSVQPVSPFKPSGEWSASTAGGSMYFDGTGDYVTIPDNELFEMSGDFTVEAFFYLESLPGSGQFADIVTKGAAGVYQPYYLFINASGSLLFYSSSSGASWDVASAVSLGTIIVKNWYHVALSRSGSSLRVFLNGVLKSTITNSNALVNNNRAVTVGARSDGTEDKFVGYISNVRINKGTGIYTAAFTPPTAPLTSVANTTLLLSGTNGGIVDYSSKTILESVGDVKIRNNVKKFGNTSIYFDGSGDFLQSFKSDPNLIFGTGEFTVECWVYFNASGQHGICQISTNPGGFNASTSNSIAIQRSATGQWEIYAKNTQAQANATINQNQWYHLAVVRSGTTTRLYVDGSSVITVTSDNTDYTGTYIGIGAIYSTAVPLNAYIDDFRVTRGVARYTANFTPPTSSFLLK